MRNKTLAIISIFLLPVSFVTYAFQYKLDPIEVTKVYSSELIREF